MNITNYNSAIEYLFSRIQFGMKAGLENISQLCKSLDSPHKRLKCIHIAGTNGKGSTSYYISKLLMSHGYTVGLFTSPHLVSVRERIRINDQPISEDDLIQYTQKVAYCSSTNSHTFFETVTAIAFSYFADQNVDYAVIETGLGGRLDSTNICNSIVTGISSIALDHTSILGNTVSEILSEKLGIAKPNIPMVISPLSEGLTTQAKSYCNSINAPFSSIKPESVHVDNTCTTIKTNSTMYSDLVFNNAGTHYGYNAALALTIVEKIHSPLSPSIVKSVFETIHWPARMQHLYHNSQLAYILDGAHNPAGLRALITTLDSLYPEQTFPFLISTLEDKDYHTVARLIEPKASQIIITKSSHPKSVSPEIFQKCFIKPVITFHSQVEAFEYCTSLNTPVICTGSLYFMGDLVERLKWTFEELAWFRSLTPDSNEVR
ncbi:MAG: bifunctional folylpolyglutamate synthase/dihydrofolate synthase [Fibrobacterales bacterium]